MNNDIEFLTTKLGKLDGFGDTGEYLQRIIKSKQVKTVEVEPVTEPATEKKDEVEEDKAGPAEEAAESAEKKG